MLLALVLVSLVLVVACPLQFKRLRATKADLLSLDVDRTIARASSQRWEAEWVKERGDRQVVQRELAKVQRLRFEEIRTCESVVRELDQTVDRLSRDLRSAAMESLALRSTAVDGLTSRARVFSLIIPGPALDRLSKVSRDGFDGETAPQFQLVEVPTKTKTKGKRARGSVRA